MSDRPLYSDVDDIGVVAGLIWQFLAANGPVTLTKLSKEIESSRDMVMQGVGWLAREGKVKFVETARSKLISLAN